MMNLLAISVFVVYFENLALSEVFGRSVSQDMLKLLCLFY
jgi:hypothetical protein